MTVLKREMRTNLLDATKNCTTCFYNDNGECKKKGKTQLIFCTSHVDLQPTNNTCSDCIHKTKCPNKEIKEEGNLCSEFTMKSSPFNSKKSKSITVTQEVQYLKNLCKLDNFIFNLDVEYYPMLCGLPICQKELFYKPDDTLDVADDMNNCSILIEGENKSLFMFPGSSKILMLSTNSAHKHFEMNDYAVGGLDFILKQFLNDSALKFAINPTIEDFDIQIDREKLTDIIADYIIS